MLYPIRIRAGAVIVEEGKILLAEFQDENGLHYNLPAGGVEEGESIKEAVVREAFEETGAQVEVETLAFTYEYAPHLNDQRYGPTHTLSMFFSCNRTDYHSTLSPSQPDPTQTGIKWVPLSELHSIVLYPMIQDRILKYIQEEKQEVFIEENELVKK
ncbi:MULTISPECIES: NUDIX domain-containing protein [Bacillaceae]|uniref:NUDIX domain-containing protein n=1 Tax=Bacillaceae TaxID=186817 RepID=UPI001C5926D4|nr:NUDIX domain-containing protein [Rossellomorea sp. YZS02]MBW3113121.1 NUDIX domain-containing protein [Bacillus sp. MCCB 382]MDX8343720.1 NUDIX domain-containing protein [Rossellomorea sp. YZS02]